MLSLKDCIPGSDCAGLLVVLTSGLVDSEHLVLAGEILSLNLLGMTTIAAEGRKALRNLALALGPPKKEV